MTLVNPLYLRIFAKDLTLAEHFPFQTDFLSMEFPAGSLSLVKKVSLVHKIPFKYFTFLFLFLFFLLQNRP